DQELSAGRDEAFIVHFDTQVETLQGLTSSPRELASALNRLRVPGAFATLLYSAIQESSEIVMRQQPARKVFILLTDRVAFRDSTSMEAAIEFAQRTDTIIYSIRFSDHIPVARPFRAAILAAASERGKHGLQRMAQETAGVSYEVRKDESIEAIYSQIEEALRHQYNIGYTPGRAAPDGQYHHIKVTTRDPHLIVHARDGYYAK